MCCITSVVRTVVLHHYIYRRMREGHVCMCGPSCDFVVAIADQPNTPLGQAASAG